MARCALDGAALAEQTSGELTCPAGACAVGRERAHCSEVETLTVDSDGGKEPTIRRRFG